MKKLNHYVLFLFLLGIVSCKKDNLQSIPLEQSFEDPDVALSTYEQAILSSEFGWEMSLSSNQQNFHAGYVEFESATVAKFTVDDLSLAGQPLQSTTVHFSVQHTKPTLSFPSGSYTTFALAESGVDTSFSFQAVRRDSIFLLGNTFGTQLVMAKATAKKQEAYTASGVVAVQNSLVNLSKLPKYFKRITVNGASYDLHFDLTNHTLYIHYGGTERFKIHETLYAPTATGLVFEKPLVDGVTTIAYMDDFYVSTSGDELACTVNNLPANLINDHLPSAYDIGSAVRFYQNPFYSNGQNRYSASLKGFTVAGVEDAYGLLDMEGYSFLVFFHDIQENYGAMQYFFSPENALHYGMIVYQQVSPSGLIRFLFVEDIAEEPPVGIKPALDQTRDAFSDEEGFFVIKTGAAAYDLVSFNIENGQKWIRFE